MLSLLGLDSLAAMMAVVAAAIAVAWAALFRAKRQGAAGERRKATEADYARSKKIENAADRARAADDAGHVDPVERLRKRGRIRD